MRKLVLAGWLCFGLSLTGCGLVSWFYEKPKGGGQSTAEIAQGIVGGIPIWGQVLSGIIGLGGIIYGGNRHVAHKKTHMENQKLRAKIPADLHPPT